MVQVFANLLSNALKFMPPGRSPRVEIAATRQDGRTHVTVDDNGIGVPMGERTAIFRLFSRGTHSEMYPGSGVGLAVVRLAVERQGGRVHVEDAPGGGARFRVELPEGESGPTD